VKASGEIEVAPDAVIQGNVLPNSAEQNLPSVSIESFDPEGKDGIYDWTSGMTSLVGRARYSGNLTIGDLEMAEGLLYVDGNVTVTGTVKGKGAIVATGKITLTGTMDTQADHAALVAKDDITIHGNGPASSRFQGLIYSEGSIDIAKTTVLRRQIGGSYLIVPARKQLAASKP
jgi:cytoskeletal protein CcmA (bactofilin family)